MTHYQPGLSAHATHSALKSAVKTMDAAHQNAVLWFGEILQRQLYRDLGYSSINQYAQVALGFSPSRTGDFLQLCRKLEKLPKVKDQVATGKLGYTKAREVVKVADETNQQQWLEVAQNRSRRELEREVKRARQEAADQAVGQGSLLPLEKRPAAAVPVRVGLEMSPSQFARYEALWEQVRKQGSAPADKVEALLEALACYVAETSPRGDVSDAEAVVAQDVDFSPPAPARNYAANRPAVQVHVHQCPDCDKTTVQTSRGELPLSPAERDHALCDAQVSRPGKRNTATIPPKIRHFVLARDRHRCQRPGCSHSRHLEVHHIVSRLEGGSNREENLITLCAGCHRLYHEKKWEPELVTQDPPHRTGGNRLLLPPACRSR